MKTARKFVMWPVWLLFLLSVIIAALVYPRLPEEVAAHWNIDGEVDGYMPKFWGIFLIPVLMAFIALLFTYLPKIDPLGMNIIGFEKQYRNFALVFMGFMLAIMLLMIAWSFGYEMDIRIMMAGGLGVLFFYLGVVMEKVKRNWFIGIRTPWTMSSDRVWEKTHALGGKLFKASGLLALAGVLVPNYAFYLILGPAIISSLVCVIYSYLEYRKENG